MSIWRRVRAAAVIAVLWAVGWAAVSVVWIIVNQILAAMRGFPVGGLSDLLQIVGRRTLLVLAVGLVVGFGFSLIVAGGERSRAVGSLALARLAAWGGIASALLVGVFVAATSSRLVVPSQIMKIMAVFAVMGAASAVGTLLLARRGREVALPLEDAPPQIS